MFWDAVAWSRALAWSITQREGVMTLQGRAAQTDPRIALLLHCRSSLRLHALSFLKGCSAVAHSSLLMRSSGSSATGVLQLGARFARRRRETVEGNGAKQGAFPAAAAGERSALTLTVWELYATLLMLQLLLRVARKLALSLASC